MVTGEVTLKAIQTLVYCLITCSSTCMTKIPFEEKVKASLNSLFKKNMRGKALWSKTITTSQTGIKYLAENKPPVPSSP